MNTITKLLTFALAITTAAAAHAQVTGTSLPNKTTLTSGNVTTTSPFVYTDGVGLGVRKVTVPDLMDFGGWGPLDTGVLAGLNVGGLLTTSGITSVTGTISGTLTVSGLSSMTTLSATTLTLSGLSTLPTLVSTTGTITNLVGTTLTLGGAATVTGGLNVTGSITTTATMILQGILSCRNGQTTLISIGDAGTAYATFGSATLQQYFVMSSQRGFALANATTPNVGLISLTDGVIRVNNASTGIGGLQTGGFLPNIRTTLTSTNVALTDYTVTFTNAGAVTLTLPSAISRTGQLFYLKNLSAVSGTAATTSSQTIDGITTQAILGNSTLGVQSDGANFIKLTP